MYDLATYYIIQGIIMVPRFVIRKESFGGIIYDRSSFQFYTIDCDAYQILYDIKLYGRNYAQEKYQNHFEIEEYINDLCEIGLNNTNIIEAKIIDEIAPINALSMPIKVYLTVTDKCNLRCKHCFGAFGKGYEMSVQQVEHILDQLEVSGVCQIGLTGGEPFCHPNIFEIIKMIVNRGFTLQTTTNGTLINQNFIDAFKEYGSSCFRLSISFDGIPAIHDSIRGRGTFDRAMAGVKILQSNNINFAFNTVITNQNYSSLEDFLNIMLENGMENGSFSLIAPTGRAKNNEQLLFNISSEDFDDIIHHVKSCIRNFAAKTGKPQYMTGAFIQPDGREIFDSSVEVARELGIKRCSAGVYIATICADGTVIPCIYLLDILKDLNLKPLSMFNCSLSTIWNTSEQFLFARSLKLHEHCSSCSYYNANECTGGCPAVSYYYFNDINMYSPYCKGARKQISGEV